VSSRSLTTDEIALARSVFAEAIEYTSVSVNARKWWLFQPKRVTMAPNGSLWFHPKGGLYCDNFCAKDLSAQGLFIHEMTHVWQHQQGVNLILRRHPFCRYDYALRPGWPLNRYGIEQQAEIVRHVFLLKAGGQVPGAPSLTQYEGILPAEFAPIAP